MIRYLLARWLLLLGLMLCSTKAQFSNIAKIDANCGDEDLDTPYYDALNLIQGAISVLQALISSSNIFTDSNPNLKNHMETAYSLFGTQRLNANTVRYSTQDINALNQYLRNYNDLRAFFQGQTYARNQINDDGTVSNTVQNFRASPNNIYVNCVMSQGSTGAYSTATYVGQIDRQSDPNMQMQISANPGYAAASPWYFVPIPQQAPFFTDNNQAIGTNGRFFTRQGPCSDAQDAATGTSFKSTFRSNPITSFSLCPSWFRRKNLNTLANRPVNGNNPLDFVTKGSALVHEACHAFGFHFEDNVISGPDLPNPIKAYGPYSLFGIAHNYVQIDRSPVYTGTGTNAIPDAYHFFAIMTYYPTVSWSLR